MGIESKSQQSQPSFHDAHKERLDAIDQIHKDRLKASRESAYVTQTEEQSEAVKGDLKDLRLERFPVPEGLELAEKTKILEASVAKRVDALTGNPSLADDFKAWAMNRGSGLKKKLLMALLPIMGLNFVGRDVVKQAPDTVEVTSGTFGPGEMSHETDGQNTSGDFRYQDSVAKDSVVNEFTADGENGEGVMKIVEAIKNGAKMIDLSATASREGRKNDTVAKDRTEAMYQLIAEAAAAQEVDISGVQFNLKSDGVNTEVDGKTLTDEGLKEELQNMTGKTNVDQAIRDHDRGNILNPKLDQYLKNARSVKVKVSGISLAPLAKETKWTKTTVTPGAKKKEHYSMPVQQPGIHGIVIGEQPNTPYGEYPPAPEKLPLQEGGGGGGDTIPFPPPEPTPPPEPVEPPFPPPPPPPPPFERSRPLTGQGSRELQPMKTVTKGGRKVDARKVVGAGKTGREKVVFDAQGDAQPVGRRDFGARNRADQGADRARDKKATSERLKQNRKEIKKQEDNWS